MIAKLFGRLGWRGQCSCCNRRKSKGAIRAEEKRGYWADWDSPEDSEYDEDAEDVAAARAALARIEAGEGTVSLTRVARGCPHDVRRGPASGDRGQRGVTPS